MIVVEKNEGAKIPHSIRGTRVTFDDDLTLNLASREQDHAVHIDICHDADHALVIGAATGRAYVAQIDIPAREYKEIEVEGEEESTLEALPLDMSKVTLTLWSIE